MRVYRLVVATIAAFSAALSGSSSYAGDDFSARLSGFEEVGALPHQRSPPAQPGPFCRKAQENCSSISIESSRLTSLPTRAWARQ